MTFSFLVIEISINFTEIKFCTFLELVKEHFITIILRKKTWEGINALINHRNSNKAISRIKRPDNNITSDQLEIATRTPTSIQDTALPHTLLPIFT